MEYIVEIFRIFIAEMWPTFRSMLWILLVFKGIHWFTISIMANSATNDIKRSIR